METRKLQRTGGSTFTLSLPKRWVLATGLKPGNPVFVEELTDGSLVLRPSAPGERPGKVKRLDVGPSETRDHLLRRLIGAYISGHDAIEVRFQEASGPLVRRVAREFSRMAIGPEIIEEGRTSLVLQDLSDPRELSAERTLRRMYMTVRAMHEDAMRVVRDRDETLARDIEQRDGDVDRLYWMVAKQYSLAHLAGTTTAADWLATGVHNYRLVAKLLERIGDHAERIATAAMGLGRKLDPRILGELEAAGAESLDLLDRAFNALMARDDAAANEAVDRLRGIQKRTDALTERLGGRRGADLLGLGAIVDSIGRTAGYAADIAEIAINHVMAQG